MLLNNSTKNIKNNYNIIIIIFNKILLQACHIQLKKVMKLFLVRCCFRPWYRLSRIKTWNVNLYWKINWNVNLWIPAVVEAGTHIQRPAQLASMPQVCLTLDFISKLPNRPLNVLCVSRKITLPIHLNLLGENYYVLFSWHTLYILVDLLAQEVLKTH